MLRAVELLEQDVDASRTGAIEKYTSSIASIKTTKERATIIGGYFKLEEWEVTLLIQLLVRTTSHQKFNRLLLKAKSLPSHTQRITAPQSLRISKSTM
jgi:hypothetical protein